MHLSRIGSLKKEQVQQKTNQEWSGWNKSVPVLIFFSFFPSHESSFPKVNLKSDSSLKPITKQQTPRNDLMRWSWAEPEVFQSLKWCWRRRKRQTTKTIYLLKFRRFESGWPFLRLTFMTQRWPQRNSCSGWCLGSRVKCKNLRSSVILRQKRVSWLVATKMKQSVWL